MKQLQHVTTFSLIIALTGLSPVLEADAGKQPDGSLIQPDQRRIETPLKYQLTLTQLDAVKAGRLQAKYGYTKERNDASERIVNNWNPASSRRPDLINTGRAVNTVFVRSGQYDSVNSGRR